jgi:hypothetical protein
MLPQPLDVVGVSVRFHLPEEFHRFGLIAGFAGVRVWNDRFDLHRYDVPVCADKTRSTNSSAWDSHDDHSRREYTVTSFAMSAAAMCDQTAFTSVPSASG